MSLFDLVYFISMCSLVYLSLLISIPPDLILNFDLISNVGFLTKLIVYDTVLKIIHFLSGIIFFIMAVDFKIHLS